MRCWRSCLSSPIHSQGSISNVPTKENGLCGKHGAIVGHSPKGINPTGPIRQHTPLRQPHEHTPPDKSSRRPCSCHIEPRRSGFPSATALRSLPSRCSGHPVWAPSNRNLALAPRSWDPRRDRLMPPEDFSAIIDDLCRAPWLAEIEGVLSGFSRTARTGGLTSADWLTGYVKAIRRRSMPAIR